MKSLLRFGLVFWIFCSLLFGQAVDSSAGNKRYEILGDTSGIDFGPYLHPVMRSIQQHWYHYIPESARLPGMKRGTTSVVFHILKDGTVTDLRVDKSSDDVHMDDAALSSVMAAKPFAPLPAEFSRPFLVLRVNFIYNPDKSVFSISPEDNPSKPSLPVLLDKGSVEGRTYKNVSIRLEFTPAQKLKFTTPEMRTGPDGTPALVTVSAWGKKHVFSPREGTIFRAETLAAYPADHRSLQAYMVGVVESREKEGFALVDASADSKLSDVSFKRADFKKGLVYEAVLVKGCENHILMFVFTGPARESVDKLVAATDLKIDLPGGCNN